MSDGIRPFRIEISQADLDCLHDRDGSTLPLLRTVMGEVPAGMQIL